MNNKKIYLAAFIVPILIITAVLAIEGFYPFGDKMLLSADMDIQYVDFFGYLKNVLEGSDSLFYSFYKSLGGNMITLVAYYLASPLNLLVYFFSLQQLPVFILCLSLLKYGLAGMTAAYFFKRRFSFLDWEVLLFSLAYSLSQYMINNMRNLMWIDGVILLPLALLGAYQLITQQKKGLLFVSVACSVFFNWYTGYMVCLMTTIYFIYELLANYDYRIVFTKQLRAFAKFISVLLLGVGASACLFLPNVFGLMTGKGSSFSDSFQLYKVVGPRKVVQSFLPGTSPGEAKEVLFYCGTLMLLLLVLYFLNPSFSRRNRLITALITLGFLLVPVISVTDALWSGGKPSSSYGTRYSFCFIFFFLYVCAHSYRQLSTLSIKRYWAGLVAAAAATALAAFKDGWNYAVIIGVLLLMMTGVLLYHFRQAWRPWQVLLIGALLAGELFTNTMWSYTAIYYPRSYQEYKAYVSETAARTQELQQLDGTDYRYEETTNRIDNFYDSAMINSEALMYQIPGIQHYTSTYDGVTDTLLADLGYNISGNTEQPYNTAILPSDALLGVKYVFSSEAVLGYQANAAISNLYENPYALPLGFIVNPMAGTEISAENAFEYVNQLYSQFLGEPVQLYSEVPINEAANDGTKVTLHAQTEPGAFVYVQGISGVFEEKKVTINQEVLGEITGYFHEGILGFQAQRETSTIAVANPQNDLQVVVYQLDIAALQSVTQQLRERSFEALTRGNATLTGNMIVDDSELLLLTLPYDENWQLVVNNQPVQTKNIQNFIGVPVNKGTNQVQLTYVPKGLKAGCGISVVSILSFLLWQVIEKKNRSWQ